MTLYQQEKITVDFLPAFFGFAEKRYQFFLFRVLNI